MFEKLLDFLSGLADNKKFITAVVAICVIVVVYIFVVACGALTVDKIDWKYGSEVSNEISNEA